jgi:biopolymer transport protein TolQ
MKRNNFFQICFLFVLFFIKASHVSSAFGYLHSQEKQSQSFKNLKDLQPSKEKDVERSKKTSFAPPTMFQLFIQAELIVKMVIVSLLLSSIWSWAIIFSKFQRLRLLNQKAEIFEEAFWSGIPLDDLHSKLQNKLQDRLQDKEQDPMVQLFFEAMKEWKRSFSRNSSRSLGSKGIENISGRIDRVMSVIVGREIDSLEKYMGFLSSLASNGMIVGLFGTVLGIMNSFQAIAAQQNTNLAVVAPGIAEALFATAIGLVAAIPSSIAYTKLSSDINRYANRLDAFSNEFSSILSRQFDEAA